MECSIGKMVLRSSGLMEPDIKKDLISLHDPFEGLDTALEP